MRTGGGIVSLGLLASAAIAVAAPQPAPDVQLSAAGVLEADKPLTIGVRGDRGSVFVPGTLLPDDVIARLYRDVKARRIGGVSRAAVGQIGVPAQATLAHLDRESDGSFVAAVDLRPLLGGKRGVALVEARRGSRSVRELYQVTDLRRAGPALADPFHRPGPAAVDRRGGCRRDDHASRPEGTLRAARGDRRGGHADHERDGERRVAAARSRPARARGRRERPGGRHPVGRPEHRSLPTPATWRRTRYRPARSISCAASSIEAALFTDRDVFQRGDTLQAVGWIAAASAVHADGMRLLPAGSRLRLTLAHGRDDAGGGRRHRHAAGQAVGHAAGARKRAHGRRAGLAGAAARGRAPAHARLPRRAHRVGVDREAGHRAAQRPFGARSARRRRGWTMVDPTGQMSPTGTIWHEMTCEPIWRFRPAGVPDGWPIGDPAQKPTRVSGAVNPRPEDARAGMIPFVISSAHAPPAATSWCRVRVRSPDRSGRDRTAEAVFLVHPGATYVALHAAEQNRDRRDASVRVGIRAVSTAGTPAAPRGVTLELDEDDEHARPRLEATCRFVVRPRDRGRRAAGAQRKMDAPATG